MANYCCTVRTNYFRVKDEDKFKELMSRAHACEDQISVWEKLAGDGTKLFGFGCYGCIGGLRNAECDEDDDADDNAYAELITGLQQCVAPGDAVIIMEAGNEKLRYVIGTVEIITSTGYDCISMERVAINRAREMLENSVWNTTCCY